MVTPWANQNINLPIVQNKSDNKNIIPKIAICVPFNSNWPPEWTERLYIPLTYMTTNWCQKMAFLCRVPSLPIARDILVKNALQANCDYILFVDSDHVLETPADPNIALQQLYRTINKSKDVSAKNYRDGRIVSALYRAKQKTGFSYAMWMKYEDKGFTSVSQWDGNWLQVDVVGLGFCLIDMMVFKEIQRPWFHWDKSDEMSEDFYFCTLAKKNGFNTTVFTDIKMSHLGNLKVKCDGTVTTQDV